MERLNYSTLLELLLVLVPVLEIKGLLFFFACWILGLLGGVSLLSAVVHPQRVLVFVPSKRLLRNFSELIIEFERNTSNNFVMGIRISGFVRRLQHISRASFTCSSNFASIYIEQLATFHHRCIDSLQITIASRFSFY